jgi:hypothetical protein
MPSDRCLISSLLSLHAPNDNVVAAINNNAITFIELRIGVLSKEDT